MTEILNAKIESANIEFNGGVLVFWIHLSYGGGSGQGFGGYRVDLPKGGQLLAKIIETVGVESWNKLKGNAVRAKVAGGYGGQIVSLGHFLDDTWVTPSEILK